jgi:hypothetical protein
MPHVEHRDRREQEAVGDRDERVVEVGIGERAERDDRQMRDRRDRAPQGGLPGRRYFVGVDGFLFDLWPAASECSGLIDSLLAAKPLVAHFFFCPFSSYS